MRAFSAIFFCALFIVGCGSSPTTLPPATPHPTPTILRWGLVGLTDVPSLDPTLASDATSISLDSLIYGGLVRLDSHLHVQPDGAARWTITNGGKVYTFYLRHNLRFPDGRRVTAGDFAASLRRALGPDGAAGAASFYLGLIARSTATGRTRHSGIVVLNPTTLRLTLTRPAAHFLAELAFPASYVPEPRIVSRYGQNWTDHAQGFGPFQVQTWRHGRFLTLRRNPHYYGGTPRLRTINLNFYSDKATAISAFRNRRVDIVSGLPAGQSISAAGVPGTWRIPGLALDYLAFNTKRLPFFRLNARRAFAAVWSPSFATTSMGLDGFPARGILPSSLAVNVGLWRPKTVASTYLKAARYPNPHRFPAVILAVPRDSHVYAMAMKLTNAWQKYLGVTISIRQLNTSDYTTVLNAHAFDLAVVRWGGDYADPQDFLGTQLGTSADNVTQWTGRSYETAVNLADSYAPTDVRRTLLFKKAAGIAAQKVPIVPLDEPAQTALISPALQGVALTALGTISADWARTAFAR